MEELKKLLSVLNEKSSTDDIESTFVKIADLLLLRSYIHTVNGDYRLLEIEFYFYNGNHKDDVTMKRTENEKAGMWWLHECGVDISFESKSECNEEQRYYGGILVRSIVNLKTNKVICGPRNCCWWLFSSSALEENKAPQIIINNGKYELSDNIGRKERYITGENKGIDNAYRFYIKDIKQNIDKNYKASPWKE